MSGTFTTSRWSGRGLPSADSLLDAACEDSEKFLRDVVVAVFNDGLDRAQELLLVHGLRLAPLDVYRWIERRHKEEMTRLQYRIDGLERELEEERNPSPSPSELDHLHPEEFCGEPQGHDPQDEDPNESSHGFGSRW